MVHQLVPFVRFDGYHILADLTGVPDLFSHIKPTLLHMLPTHWGKREAKVLKPWARAVVTLWVLMVVPVLAVALAIMVKVLPRVAATAWDSIGARWEILQSNWTDGNSAAVAVGMLSMMIVALPVLSMSYLLIRIVRRSWLRVWRATAGRRGMRTLAVVAGVVGLALLSWAWWPDGQYRPIQPNESGTLFDTAQPPRYGPAGLYPTSVEMPFAQPVTSPLSAPALGTHSVRPRLVMLRSPEGVPITEPGPKRIIMLPRPGEGSEGPTDKGWISTDPPAPPGGGERGWPFPFNPPAPPTEGDNQAFAVNTEDGSSVYDVAFAVLWVTDSPVDQINEAWALANCSDCRTTAVAFQSIFVVGDSDVVIPQNRAVAVNYECRRCETNAVAVQLVTTLTRPPSDETMNKLALVWDDLEMLEKNAEELPLDQLHAELARIEGAIVGILVEDGVLVLPDGGVSEDGASDSPAPFTDETTTEGSTSDSNPSTAGDPGADATATEETTSNMDGDEGTDSSDPSPAPAEEPSPTPTSEPSPTPEEEPSPTPTSGG
jgi:putative peptide zinc metalloprotease protein